MVTLVFSAINAQRAYCEFSYTHASLAVCLDQVTFLVDCDWTLIRVKCRYQEGAYFSLPVDAFDGTPFGPTLNQLEWEWKKLLLPV